MVEATAREVREETGLAVTVGEPVGWVERIGDDHHYVIVDFLAAAVDPEAPLRPGDDAAEAAWIELGELSELDLVPGLLEFLTEHGIATAAPPR
jgi:ADP-ribose pyrophosphatase YjhB (NUDIX family)